MPAAVTPRLSGHETFVCRYAWLPKVIRELSGPKKKRALFKDEADAMVRLGVGKNMVRSIRFWAESAQIIEPTEDGYAVTRFGERLLGREGHDPFLERSETLWLLHWKIATNPEHPIFYWEEMLNRWHRAEFSASEVLPFLENALPSKVKRRSARTLSDGFRVFVNTYIPTRGRKGQIADDNLDSPLVELELIRPVGERATHDQSIREPIYAFNLENKPSVTAALFAYCLHEFWCNRHPDELTLAFRFASSAEGSPGQIFKLPELAVRTHLEKLARTTKGVLEFVESSSMPQVILNSEISHDDLLDAIYPID